MMLPNLFKIDFLIIYIQFAYKSINKMDKYVCDGLTCRFVSDTSSGSSCCDDSSSESTHSDKVTNTSFPFPKSSDEWTIYGASWCEYCQLAKTQLEAKGFEIVYHDCESIPKNLENNESIPKN